MSKPLIQFRPNGLENFFANRNKENANHIARTALTRYQFIVEFSESSLRTVFEPSELKLIFDALNGVDFSEISFIRYLPQEVLDCDSELFQKWNVDEEKLSEKLRMCNMDDFVTLIDMKERFFAGTLELEAEKTNAPNSLKN